MGEFYFIDKTADMRIHVESKNFEDLLRTSAEAFLKVMCNDVVECRIKKRISFDSKEEKVVFKFLDELLFLLDSEHFLISKVEKANIIAKGGYFHVEVFICGDLADKYELSSVIKAITYNDFLFEKKNGRLIVELTLDL